MHDVTGRVKSIFQVHNMHVEYNLQRDRQKVHPESQKVDCGGGGPSLQKDNDTEE